MIKSWNTDNVEIALRDVSDPLLYLKCNSFLPREFLLVITVGFRFLLSDLFFPSCIYAIHRKPTLSNSSLTSPPHPLVYLGHPRKEPSPPHLRLRHFPERPPLLLRQQLPRFPRLRPHVLRP